MPLLVPKGLGSMQNRVKRRGLALLVTVGLVAAPLAFPLAAPAAASPHDPHHASKHGHALVDRNGDHLSDGLDAKLSEAKSTARLDVVVTFANRGSMRGARRALGHVDTTFSLIPGFVARLTPGQVRSMAHRSGVVRVEQDFADPCARRCGEPRLRRRGGAEHLLGDGSRDGGLRRRHRRRPEPRAARLEGADPVDGLHQRSTDPV